MYNYLIKHKSTHTKKLRPENDYREINKMYVDLHINEPFSVKKGLTASAKGTGPGQPAQSGHALISA